MERQLPGILAMAVVCGTMITLLAIQGRDPILITGIIYPESMERSNDRYTFTVSFVATRDLDDVEIRIRSFSGYGPKAFDLLDVERADLEKSFPMLITLTQTSSSLGMKVIPSQKKAVSGPNEYDLSFYDFSEVFEMLFRQNRSPLFTSATSHYGFLWNKGRLSLVFKGGAEIFPMEPLTVTEIVIEEDGDTRVHWQTGDEPVHSMARFRIEKIQRDTKVDLIYYVDGRRVGGGPLLHLIDLRAEGELYHSGAYLTNV